MVALSSSAMPSQSTQCPRILHSRHVFVECFLETMLGLNLNLDEMLCIST